MSYQIVEYTKENFIGVLADFASTPIHFIEKKQHTDYFDNYFTARGVKTFLVEKDYVDYDYLADYASYYAKCFFDYSRKCSRLHFFSSEITDAEFKGILRGEDRDRIESLQENYLGFIVVKPLPQTIIGRTCLKTYPDENSSRFYPTSRRYEANLFGIPLYVESIAYQEQDSVAAACATSALWSAFHCTGKLFQHTIPSPIEITKSATKNILDEKRSLPNKGLTLEQMAHAVRDIGLEPYKIGVSNPYWLKATVSGYMRARVPLILAGQLVDTSITPNEAMGGHAIAIMGYRTEAGPAVPLNNFHLVATKINKLYVHDDQIGPYAKMDFDGTNVLGHPSLWSSWKGKRGRGKIGDGRFIPEAVLVPLYHKIRIPYEVIFDIIYVFDETVNKLKSKNLFPITETIEWDIFLENINSFKEKVFSSVDLPRDLKEEVLLGKMPKYIWRAQAYVNGTVVLEFLFDATDIEQGKMLYKTIGYDNDLYCYLVGLSKDTAYIASVYGTSCYQIFHWLSNQQIPAP